MLQPGRRELDQPPREPTAGSWVSPPNITWLIRPSCRARPRRAPGGGSRGSPPTTTTSRRPAPARRPAAAARPAPPPRTGRWSRHRPVRVPDVARSSARISSARHGPGRAVVAHARSPRSRRHQRRGPSEPHQGRAVVEPGVELHQAGPGVEQPVASSGSRPPTPITGSVPRSPGARTRPPRGPASVSGRPESPPRPGRPGGGTGHRRATASCWWRSPRPRPRSRHTSSSSAIAGSVRSGRSSPAPAPPPPAPPAARRGGTPVLQAAQPGVFGEETLTAK